MLSMARFVLVALLAAFTLAVAGCGGEDEQATGGGGGGDGESQEMVDVSVGILPLAALAPIYVGIDQGFFEEEGINLTPRQTQGGAEVVPAVMSGDFEFGYSNNVSLLLAQQRGLDLRIVAEGNQEAEAEDGATDAVVSASDSGIDTPEDLAGKTIGVNTLNNIGEVVIKTALEERGVDVSGLKFVEIPFPEMVAAVDAGRIDAGWVVEPFVGQAKASDMNVLIRPFFETQPRLSIATYFTSGKYAEENPDVVERFIRAMNRSLEYTQEHPDELIASLQQFTEIPAEVAENMALPQFSSEINVDSIELLADKMVEYGIVEERPDVQAMLPEGE